MSRQLIRTARMVWPVLFVMAGQTAAQTAASDATGLDGCSISAWSTDRDPTGLNVRAGPGIEHSVIGRLPPPPRLMAGGLTGAARMPGTCASFGRSDAITSSTERVRCSRGTSSTKKRPVLMPPAALLPTSPTLCDTPATSGSAITISASSS